MFNPIWRSSAAFLLFIVLLYSTLFNQAPRAERTELLFAPGQIVVEFQPGVVFLDANPGQRFIPIENIPISLPGLRSELMSLGIAQLEVFGGHWRNIDPDPEWKFEELNHVPVRLKSFRDWYVLHFPRELQLQYVVEVVRELPGIKRVGRNPLLELTTDYWPTDTLLGCPDSCGRNYQWNMENTGGEINGVECDSTTDIGLRGAYAIQETCYVKIGLADTGVDRDHEDLDDNLDDNLGRNFTNNPTDTLAWDDGGSDIGHGTASAGIIGALHSADSTGVAGICGRIKPNTPVIVPLKVWSNAEEGDTMSNVCTWLIDAMSYTSARVNTIPILVVEAVLTQTYHLPLPPGTDSTDFITATDVAALQTATYNAYHEGLLIVAPGGNQADLQGQKGRYPAEFLHMTVGVSALGCNGSREPRHASGKHIDLAAPGHANDEGPGRGLAQIVSTMPDDGYSVENNTLFSGTSAAVPHVGGVAGLLLSDTSQLTNEDLREIMQSTARDMGDAGYDHDYGHGLVRADSSLEILDNFVLVHDSTSTIDSQQLDPEGNCRTQYFKDLVIAATPAYMVTNWDTLKAEVYRFETTVDLTENTNSSHVPEIWPRGRQCISARDTVKYDGRFEPYFAEVVSVSDDEATLRGRAYKVFTRHSNCQGDSFVGWFPINPYAESSVTVFSHTFLADMTSGDSRPPSPAMQPNEPPTSATLILSDQNARLRFSSPFAEGGTLRIFDIEGRQLHRLDIPPGEAGLREVEWRVDRLNRARLARGIYMGSLSMNKQEQAVRIVVLR